MDCEYILMPNGELYHWGIKGMKWGQRRYQNKDGSLTPAGKKRYNDSVNALKEREKVIKNREREKARQAKLDAKKADLDAREKALDGDAKASKKSRKDKKAEAAETPKKKSISEMTDEELNQAIQRARMEDAYRQLRPEPVAQPKMSERLMKEVVGPAMLKAGEQAVKKGIDAAINYAFKEKPDPNSIAALERTVKELDLKRQIKILKNGGNPNEKPLSWEDQTKKYHLEREMKADRKAEEDAKKAAKEAKKAAKKAAKNTDESDDAPDTADTADSINKGRRQQQNWDAMNRAGANSTRRPDRVDQDNFDFDYEPPKAKVTVEGKGTSHKQTTSDRKRPDPIIIDADEYPASSSGLPAIYNRNTAVTDIAPRYTDAGRTYVETLLLPAPKDRDD